jgi:FkbM family methyltransferase
MKKVILDCGSNLGQGFESFKKAIKVDSAEEIEVHMFEPNVNCYNVLCEKYSDKKHITINNKAVWDKEEERILNVEWSPPWDVEGKIWEGEIGGTSNILQENFVKPDYIKDEYMGEWPPKYEQTTTCIDLSNFIKTNFSLEDEIYLKLDVEGAEFPVFNKMIEDDTLKYINTLAVEWHDEMIKECNLNELNQIYSNYNYTDLNMDQMFQNTRNNLFMPQYHRIMVKQMRKLRWTIGAQTGEWKFPPCSYFEEEKFVQEIKKHRILLIEWT